MHREAVEKVPMEFVDEKMAETTNKGWFLVRRAVCRWFVVHRDHQQRVPPMQTAQRRDRLTLYPQSSPC